VEARLAWLRWHRWVLTGIAALALAVAGRWLWRALLIGWSAEGRVAWSYARLTEMALRLGVTVHSSDTPAEFAMAMRRELEGRRPRWARLARVVQQEVAQILAGVSLVTQVYERVSYAAKLPDLALMGQAWRKGWRLRWQMWRLLLFSSDQ
jgi:hypothetical protein